MRESWGLINCEKAVCVDKNGEGRDDRRETKGEEEERESVSGRSREIDCDYIERSYAI